MDGARLVLQSSPPDSELAQLWTELQTETRTAVGTSGRTAPLLVSDDVAYPVAVGVLRPAVLLPRGWLNRPTGRPCVRSWSMKRRTSCGTMPCCAGLQRCFKSHFTINHCIGGYDANCNCARKFWADAQAAARAHSTSDYAEQLVALLNAAPGRSRQPLSAMGIVEGRSELYRRIEMLLKCPQTLEMRSGRRWNSVAAIVLLLFACSLGLVTLRAADSPPVSPKSEENKSQQAVDAPQQPEFRFRVLNRQQQPVVGADVQVWGYSLTNSHGSGGIDSKSMPSVKTDAGGVARIVMPTAGSEPQNQFFRQLAEQGFERLALKVEHPDHPTWSKYVFANGSEPIVLADPTTVEVHAHLGNETGMLRHLYPALSAGTLDWSEAEDGLLKIRRVNLASDEPTRWLRIVHVPAEGPACYSDLLDLLKFKGNPVSIDTRN